MPVTDRLLAAGPVAATGRRVTRRRLRVLAMHGVEDVEAFERQLADLLRWFVPVDAGRVLEWYRGDRDLPDRAVWITFDDGERSTVVDAAPVLRRHRVPATVFVCPGLVETGRAPWWAVVQRAADAGLSVELDGSTLRGPLAVSALKRVPDASRRRVVAQLATEVGDEATDPVTVEDLHRWRELGGEIGNHTWDHPCLDRCDPAEQVAQIDRAAEWLDEQQLWERRVFAYPNGDRTDDAERHLAAQGYELVALFDHHLVSRRRGPLQISRLRLDAAAEPARTAAVTSGTHSGLFAVRSRVRPSRAPVSR